MKKNLSRLGAARQLVLLTLLLFCSIKGFSQNNEITVQGKVRSDSSALEGVSVILKSDQQKATRTDAKGNYTLKVPANGTLIFSYIGYEDQEVDIQGSSILNTTMKLQYNNQSEVVVVAYGTQKKASLVSSITTVNPKEIKGPTSNLTTMLAGAVPGIISYQRSGEPGADNAQFFVRGVGTFGAGKIDPLILIDGIESSSTDLARLQPDDIAGFSVLKDATASAVFGARGANGVILVTTKRGEVGKIKFNYRIENSVSTNTQNFDLADNVTYMRLANEAVLTRNALGALPYSQNKIDHTERGDDPFLYPSNNWINQLIKDRTYNRRMNLNVSGGADKAKYYLAMTFNVDNGILKENELNNFSNNIKLKAYSILSNVTLALTKTTEAVISLKGQFDNYNGPVGGGGAVFYNALWSNPVAFPAVYPASLQPYTNHPLFGNALIPGGGLYVNPYASSLSGYQSSNTSTFIAQLNLNQKLDAITPGLSARMMAYTTRYANFSVARRYSPYYYFSNIMEGKFNGLSLLNDGTAGSPGPNPTEYLTYQPGGNVVNSTVYGEGAINYNRVFNDKHSLNGMLIGIIRNYLTGNANTLQLSLPFRNAGVSGRFGYGYDNRYNIEFDFGYNGSERFAANNRFGFFPSVGAGWTVSNEKFFESLLSTVSKFKLRATYGLVGNDQIGRAEDRFFYLSDVNLNNLSTGNFGTNYNYSRPTTNINRYSNFDITWELSKQTNIGMDLTVFKNLNLTVDAYQNERSNILMIRNTIPTTMGLQADIQANSGKASSRGIDIAMDYQKNFSKNFWVQTRGTLTYATSKLKVNEEPIYGEDLKHLSRVGYPLGQIYGLVAERLFIDEKEVQNSPEQSWGPYAAGDIKYKDINGDGKISNADIVPIGLPASPEIIAGLGFSVGYKGFDFSAFFQGSARSSFIINSANMTPFYLNGGNQNGLLKVIADNHWSEDNRNSYSFWPRLSNTINQNNAQTSSWWLRDGSFIRLKSTELGYNFASPILKKFRLSSGRFYVNALNLFKLSKFNLWDPEMGSSGLGYPIQKVFNGGVLIGF